jgi:3-carboxy-cis,cis-muconate cycloisomerase
LGGLDDAGARLAAVRDERLALQFGGAAGTLASLGDDGLAVAAALARQLDLPAPSTPWQTNRSRVVELAAALGEATGAAGKVGTDIVLLAQTEVGEVAAGGEGGGSSTLPHKRNPVAAVTAVAAARRTPGLVATMLAAMPGEEERAAGAWQAEAETLAELLRLTGAAVAAIRGLLEGLEVFPDRMRANLELTDGLVMAESLASALGEILGRARAQELVGEASKRAVAEGRPLSEVAAGVPEIADALGPDGIRDALDPSAYLGATDTLIDRALAAHRGRANPR